MATSGMNLYRGKRIFVTGGNGFLGKVLVKKLYASGAFVYSPTRTELDLFHPIDIGEHVSKPPDLIFHLAAKVSGITHNRSHPYDYLYENVMMANNTVELARKLRVPIVAAGSVCVYSDEAPLPFVESDIFLGEPEITNLGYGLAKRYLLQLLHLAQRQEPSFRYVFVNSANLYGPGDHFGHGSHVIPALIHKVAISPKNGNQVRLIGSGEATRDFLHVEDAAHAYLLAGEYLLEGNESLTCNIGSGREVRIMDVLTIICSILELQPEIGVPTIGSLEGQKRRLVNSQVAYRELGWRPYKELRHGLEETIAYYQNKNAFATATTTISEITGDAGEREAE